MTYGSPPLKKNRLTTGSLTISERADSLGGFIFVGYKQFVKAFVAEGLEEPFAVIINYT